MAHKFQDQTDGKLIWVFSDGRKLVMTLWELIDFTV